MTDVADAMAEMDLGEVQDDVVTTAEAESVDTEPAPLPVPKVRRWRWCISPSFMRSAQAIEAEVQAIAKKMKTYTLPAPPSDAPDIPLKCVPRITCRVNLLLRFWLTCCLILSLNTASAPPSEFPPSYTGLSEREQLVHAFVRNFDRQFRDLYRQRRPLMLLRPNECGVQVCV